MRLGNHIHHTIGGFLLEAEAFLWVFAQDGGLEFGGLRWWAAQSGGPAWWDDTFLHQIMQRKSKRRSICFYAD